MNRIRIRLVRATHKSAFVSQSKTTKVQEPRKPLKAQAVLSQRHLKPLRGQVTLKIG